MHFPAFIFVMSFMSVDAAAPRTFLWQEVGSPSCVRCCGASEEPAEPAKKTRMKEYVMYPMPRVQPRIEMSILKGNDPPSAQSMRMDVQNCHGGSAQANGHSKSALCMESVEYVSEGTVDISGDFTSDVARDVPRQCPLLPTSESQIEGEKGDVGDKGPPGVSGKEGERGPQGLPGMKGQKGQVGPPGNSCKIQYSAFSVARRKSVHSTDYFQAVIFDTVFVNMYEHFNMFSGTFVCYVPGIYFFNLNVHTWNLKETYLHIMKNDQEMAILYAQPSDRSIMQSQSLMLEMKEKDEVWVRMFKRERENALYNDETDVYIIFNGYLIRPMDE